MTRSLSAPNIVLILADDLGFSDLGCFGGEIDTPHLDALAAGGMRLTQFYNCARCGPSRASLLTGLHPQQCGGPSDSAVLADHCASLPEMLGAAGYDCFISGKWHLGQDPFSRGFHKGLVLMGGATSYFEPDPLLRDGEQYRPDRDGFYMTDAIGDEAVRLIEAQAGSNRPFFLYAAYTAPHFPLHAWPEDIARFRGRYRAGWDVLRAERHRRQIALGVVDPSWRLSPRDAIVEPWDRVGDADEMDLRMAVFAAQVHAMDRGVGRILEALKRSGTADETLVLFLSDNGGTSETTGGPPRLHDRGTIGAADSYTSYRAGWANLSNTPFHKYKMWVDEGGIASPLIARWPGRIRPGSLSREVAHIADLTATCIDLAGASYPRSRGGHAIAPLEGKSLAPTLRGETRSGHESLCWQIKGHRAVRRERWKALKRRGDPWRLYDLHADRTELCDLAAAHPAVLAELVQTHQRWASRVGAEEPPA